MMSLMISVLCAMGAESDAILDIEWRLGPNLPELRKGGCLGVLDGKVVSTFGMRFPWGEMATTYIYDPATDCWAKGPEAPVGQCYTQGVICGNALYSVGGRIGSVSARCFRLAAEAGQFAWSEAPALSEARGWAPSVSIGTRIWVLGGAKGANEATIGTVEMLDTQNPQAAWQGVSEIPGDTRGWVGAAAVAGKIYVIGGSRMTPGAQGEKSQEKCLAEVLEYDPDSGAWRPRAPMPFRLSGMDCCVYRDRYVVVAGGAAEMEDFTPEMKQAYEKTERFECYYNPFVLVYDVQTDTWQILPSLLPLPTNDIRVAIAGDMLYALGGENIDRATSNTTSWLRIGRIKASSGQP